MRVLPAILCVFLDSVFGQQIIREAADLVSKFDAGDCQRKLRRSDPLRQFDDDFLAEICDRQLSWFEDIIMSEGAEDLLSKEQLAWLEGIWKCMDVTCICTQMDICRDLLQGIEESGDFAGLGSLASSSLDTARRWRGKRQVPPNFLNRGLGPAIRKEYRAMSDQERQAFHSAMNALKLDRIQNLSKYDILTVYHTPEQSPGAHFGPGLLPFHRELLKQLEMALRMEDPSVGLPYWDTTLDSPLPEPRDSVLWTADFFGAGVGEVQDGPFADWQTIDDAQIPQLSPRKKIMRTLGSNNLGGLLNPSNINDIMSRRIFQNLTWCVDPFFELIHGQVHMWVGGHMHEMRISPNDPTFFVYHSFIDKVWEDWRLRYQDVRRRETEYVSDAQACNTFHMGQAQMRPFRVRNIDGLSSLYTRDLYRYAPSPTCSRFSPSCGSSYLFCDARGAQPRCVSKVRPGGVCRGFEGTDVCHRSVCVQGLCVLQRPAPRTTTTTTTTTPRPPTTRTSAPRGRGTTAVPARLVRLRNQRRQVWLKFFASLRDSEQKKPTTTTPRPTRAPVTRRPRRVVTTRRTRRPRIRTVRPPRPTSRARDRKPRKKTRTTKKPTTKKPTTTTTTPKPKPKPKRNKPSKTKKAVTKPKPTNSVRGKTVAILRAARERARARMRARGTRARVTKRPATRKPPTTTTKAPTTPRPSPATTRRVVRTFVPSPSPGFSPATDRITAPSDGPTVWVPIQVMKMTGVNRGRAMGSGLIVTQHFDPRGRQEEALEGRFADPTEKPYYTGSAFAQLKSPFASASEVRAEVTVLDERGVECVATCLQRRRSNTSLATYSPCRAQIRLSQDPSSSDDVPFSPFLANARTLMWRNRGQTKDPDKFLFMCNAVRVPGGPGSTIKRTQPRPRGSQTLVGDKTVIDFPDQTAGRREAGSSTAVRTVPLPANEWLADGGCHNKHRCCDVWSKVGECSKNGWMRMACERSCFICSVGSSGVGAGCSDFHPKCAEWAKDGQCRENLDWMEENCRDACGKCSRSASALAGECGEAPPTPRGQTSRRRRQCSDEAKFATSCRAWARSGECAKNTWMNRNCRKSCKTC